MTLSDELLRRKREYNGDDDTIWFITNNTHCDTVNGIFTFLDDKYYRIELVVASTLVVSLQYVSVVDSYRSNGS
jgi:hypothetical protein